MKKKEKSTGAVFIMVIETSQTFILFIYLFIVLAFDLFYKDRFQGNCYNKPRKTYAQDLQPR